jgi:hypothetical protein
MWYWVPTSVCAIGKGALRDRGVYDTAGPASGPASDSDEESDGFWTATTGIGDSPLRPFNGAGSADDLPADRWDHLEIADGNDG